MRRILPALLLVSAQCPDTPPTQLPPATWIAHRGNSSEAPENTLAAIRSATALAKVPDYVEIDVHLSRDGRLVVIHDDTLDRTTDARGRVRDLTFEEIRRASAGHEERFGERFVDEKVPALEEVLDAVEDSPVRVMIEVKPRGLGAAVARMLEERGEVAEHVIASFEPSVLVGAKMASPHVRTLYLCGALEPEEVELARLIGAELVGVHHDGVTAPGVERAHASGIAVWAYTVNEALEAERLIRCGADGIISDRVGTMPR